MAEVAGFTVESKRGKGYWVYYSDAPNFHFRAKEVLVRVGLCEACAGPLSPSTVRCLKNRRHEGIWVAEEKSLEEIEQVLGEEKRRNKHRQRAERRRYALEQLPGFHRESDIRAILKAQGGLCYYCGTNLIDTKIFRDHLKPLNASGSSNWPSNIALACYSCNRDKSDLSLQVFWERIGKRLGSEWVKYQLARNVEVTKLAKELTKLRKLELEQSTRRTTARSSPRSKWRAAGAGY